MPGRPDADRKALLAMLGLQTASRVRLLTLSRLKRVVNHITIPFPYSARDGTETTAQAACQVEIGIARTGRTACATGSLAAAG